LIWRGGVSIMSLDPSSRDSQKFNHILPCILYGFVCRVL
jgi:hypothetical protein